jgi:hypothetical protein
VSFVKQNSQLKNTRDGIFEQKCARPEVLKWSGFHAKLQTLSFYRQASFHSGKIFTNLWQRCHFFCFFLDN